MERRVRDIIECKNCNCKVILKANNVCPACGYDYELGRVPDRPMPKPVPAKVSRLRKRSLLWHELPLILIAIPIGLGFMHGWNFSNFAGTGFRLACIALGITIFIYGRVRRRAET